MSTTHEPTPQVQEFVRLTTEAHEDAVAFYRADGREVLVETQHKGHQRIYRFQNGDSFAHVTKINWDVAE